MYSQDEKTKFLNILISKGFDIKNSVIEYNKKNNTQLERGTIYDWIKNDKIFGGEYENLRNELLDECEKMHRYLRQGIAIVDENTGKIIAWQEKPDRQAIEFYLKNKGKDRGYVDKIEVEQSGNVILTVKNQEQKDIIDKLSE